SCDAPSGIAECRAFLQLLDADGGANVGQIVFESRAKHFIVPRAFLRVALPSIVADTMQTHHAHSIGPLRVVGGGHAAFARSDRLGSVKRKAGNVADGAYFFPLITSRERMRSIFDHGQPARSRNF